MVSYLKHMGPMTNAPALLSYPNFFMGWLAFYERVCYLSPLPKGPQLPKQLIGRAVIDDAKLQLPAAHPFSTCRKLAFVLLSSWVRLRSESARRSTPEVG